jgi:hypothetical protein
MKYTITKSAIARLLIVLSSLTSLSLLIGCASPASVMNSWMGLQKTQLIGQWGPPQYKESDGSGGEIWIYQQTRSYNTPGYAQSNSQSYGQAYGTANYDPYGYANYSGTYSGQSNTNTTYMPSQRHERTQNASFYINAKGVIYNVAWSR